MASAQLAPRAQDRADDLQQFNLRFACVRQNPCSDTWGFASPTDLLRRATFQAGCVVAREFFDYASSPNGSSCCHILTTSHPTASRRQPAAVQHRRPPVRPGRPAMRPARGQSRPGCPRRKGEIRDRPGLRMRWRPGRTTSSGRRAAGPRDVSGRDVMWLASNSCRSIHRPKLAQPVWRGNGWPRDCEPTIKVHSVDGVESEAGVDRYSCQRCGMASLVRRLGRAAFSAPERRRLSD